jgi:hypothetical protein
MVPLVRIELTTYPLPSEKHGQADQRFRSLPHHFSHNSCIQRFRLTRSRTRSALE